ncbi:hypothetical protein AB6D53_12745 [Vibrio splendidus]
MLDQCHNCTVEYRPKRTKNKEQRTKNKEERRKKKEERRKKKEERRKKKVRTNYWGMEYPLCST